MADESYSILEVTGDKLILGHWGELLIPSIADSRIETASGGTLELEEHTAEQIRTAVLWLNNTTGLLLIILSFIQK